MRRLIWSQLRLHRQYLAEGIEIPFPVRTVVHAAERPADRPGPNGRAPAAKVPAGQ